ncbi:Pyrophosphatase PpaX [uncultured archaeon]|nr:Pyrophosphatase PpaX [uncultured archaeon]
MKLLLFDIDGILLKNIHSKSVPSVSKILIKKHFGVEIDPKKVYVSGMTDRGALIARLKGAGIKNPENDPRLEVAIKDFVNVTKELIDEHGVEQVEGVEELLKKLQNEKVVLGVLTGNTPDRAKLKLESANLWHYFKVGAFGHNTVVRSELVAIAIKDAKEKTGISFKKKDVFIIGDTIRDIQCAREGGVKVVAVATGKEDLETLKKEKPDFAFRDFNDIDSIIQVLV